MLLCSKAHPATITHESKDSDVYRPCPADSVYYAMILVSSLTVKSHFPCPITPFPHHYKLRAEVPLGMTAKRFFDETQADYLSNIFPPDVNVKTGEIIEIDDGLQPYFFYVNSDAAVTPLRFFRMQNSKESDS